MPDIKSKKHRTLRPSPRSDLRPLEVVPGDYKDFDAALRRFRKLVDKEGRLREYCNRQYFTKKSLKAHHRRQKRSWLLKNHGAR